MDLEAGICGSTIISDTNTLGNTYNFNYFTELYENNRSNFSIYLNLLTISNDDVKLSESIFAIKQIKRF